MPRDSGRHRHDLRAIARRVMVERDLLPDFWSAVMAEVARSQAVPLLPINRRGSRRGRQSRRRPHTVGDRGTAPP